MSQFERKERVVDDTVFYDSDLSEHWWKTIDILRTLGSSGVISNPDKLQFARHEVDFAGFRISDNKIDPLPKYLSAIQDFPTPSSTTDIRSWFGLINQLANYAQLRDHLSLFRPFLSLSTKFHWTPELDEAFTDSKAAIVEAIKHRVEIFDPKKKTCLRPDWSNKGVWYFFLQQHC